MGHERLNTGVQASHGLTSWYYVSHTMHGCEPQPLLARVPGKRDVALID